MQFTDPDNWKSQSPNLLSLTKNALAILVLKLLFHQFCVQWCLVSVQLFGLTQKPFLMYRNIKLF